MEVLIVVLCVADLSYLLAKDTIHQAGLRVSDILELRHSLDFAHYIVEAFDMLLILLTYLVSHLSNVQATDRPVIGVLTQVCIVMENRQGRECILISSSRTRLRERQHHVLSFLIVNACS